MTMMMTVMGMTMPGAIELMTEGMSEEPTKTDMVTETIGNSLSGEHGTVPSQTISLINGLLNQFQPQVGATTPVGIPPADEDVPSGGNQALWGQ